jgi:predicted aldo/keto reductase-like oxidoreductase
MANPKVNPAAPIRHRVADLPLRHRFGAGPAVSPFTLGTMRALGSAAQMAAVLGTALDIGINHIETAPAYGPAEAFVGQALAQLGPAAEPLVITSKLLPGVSLADGRRQLVASLERLRRARLDNLAVHGLNTPEHLDWALRGPGAELLGWARGEGLVGQVGFSSHGPTPLIEAALASGLFGFCSLHVHLFDQERLPLARAALAAGIGVLAISPADKGGRLFDPPPGLQEDCAPFQPLELAYRFLLDQGISTLSLGAEQPGDLALAATIAGPPWLSAAQRQALERLAAAGQQRLGDSRCGQCRACLPCPSAVPIPALLRLRNLAVGHGMETFAQERYNLIGRAGHWWEQHNASACQRCGACLPRCPLGLPIPDLLADTHRRLAAAPRRRLWG